MTRLSGLPLECFGAFGESRVLLANESLHEMPSFYEQGTIMGFEDVVELVHLLADVRN